MKNLMILLLVLFVTNTATAQQYYMNGRFVNGAPDSTSLDSVAFVFTPTTYEYYINAATAPSSFGTYSVITSTTGPDSLVLFEDALGVCNTNGGGNRVSFKLQYQLTPYYGLTISESVQSVDSCPSHSYKIQGDYIGYTGEIVFTNSVRTAGPGTQIQAHVYEGKLNISSQHSEKVSVQVMNLNGQKVKDVQHAMLIGGQSAGFDLGDLGPGVYFVVIQTEHERKAIKFVR